MHTELLGIKAADGVRRIVFFLAVTGCMVFLICTPKKAVVSFLDVGQGDGIFIRTADGKVFLIDGGSTSKKNVGEKIIVPYLKYEGEKTVDVWFLTHEDEDHINGFLQVLGEDEITIRAIALPVTCRGDESEFWKVKHIAKERGIPVLYLKEGDVIKSEATGTAGADKDAGAKDGRNVRAGNEKKGGYEIRVLSPDAKGHYDDRNDASLVLLYECRKKCFGRELTEDIFLMGDSTAQGEEAVERYLALARRDAYSDIDTDKDEGNSAGKGKGADKGRDADSSITILKAAHHGSANNSNSEDFIRKLSPDYAIISCGRNNVYGHPHKETLEYLGAAGSGVCRTDRQGYIRICVSGRKIRVIPFCRQLLCLGISFLY